MRRELFRRSQGHGRMFVASRTISTLHKFRRGLPTTIRRWRIEPKVVLSLRSTCGHPCAPMYCTCKTCVAQREIESANPGDEANAPNSYHVRHPKQNSHTPTKQERCGLYCIRALNRLWLRKQLYCTKRALKNAWKMTVWIRVASLWCCNNLGMTLWTTQIQ